MSFLKVDIAEFKAQWASLLASYPELAEDEDLRADTIEAETDAHRILSVLLKRKLDARELATGAKARKIEVGERQARLERQEEGCDALIKSLMLAADLQKVTLPEATISITKPRVTVEIVNIDDLPQGFYRKEPKKTELKAALEGGEEIPGAKLALGDDGLMVRTK